MRVKEGVLFAVRRYPIEIILILTAGIITILSFQHESIEAQDQQDSPIDAPQPSPNLTQSNQSQIDHPLVAVDVSGAVYKPGVYEASSGARIIDLVEMAGGISHEADRHFVARNYNMARMVGDQDKIYIPFTWDIALGTFVEESRILEYLSPRYPGEALSKTNTNPLSSVDISTLQLSINVASKEELDTLPGIGPVTAQKIVDNRPYNSLDEILSRKVLNTSTFEKIKDYISL